MFLENLYCYLGVALNISNLNLRVYVFLLYVYIVNISNIVTTVESYSIIFYLRFVFFILLVVFMFIVVYKRVNILFSVVPLCTLFLYNYYLISIHEVDMLFSDSINFMLIIFGVVVITFTFGKKDDSSDVERLIIFGLYLFFGFSLILLFISGGVSIEMPPKFNLTYGSLLIGREETYSLGLSNFYGLMAIVFLYSYYKRYSNDYVLVFFSIFSLYLCMLGGARGEFLITVSILCTLVVYYNLSVTKLLFIVVVFSILVSLFFLNFDEIVSSDQFTSNILLKRMELLLSGDFSSRDTLINNALELFYETPICFIAGCGIGFFQYYNDFPLSLYPHNFLIEMLVSFGILLSTSLLIIMLLGWLLFVKRTGGGILSLIFVYSFLVSLKSGSMMTSWFVFSVIMFFNCYFIAAAIQKSFNPSLGNAQD